MNQTLWNQTLCTNCQASIPSPDGNSAPLIARVSELLACNDAPLESEIDSVKAYLGGAKRRLQYVEDSIARLRGALVSLESERDTLKEHIARGGEVLHPVRRTPTELIARIFKDCIDGEICNSLDIRGMHWTLGYVCHRWKSVLLSTPHLWTDIQLYLGTAGTLLVPGKKSMKPQACRSTHLSSLSFLLGLYVTRSQSLPLTVSLSRVSNMDFAGIHPFLIVLFPTVPRWSSLFLDMEPYLIQKWFGSMQFMFSSLQVLSIRSSTDGLVGDVFKYTPALRRVIFTGIPIAHVLDTPVPIQHLTTIEIVDTSEHALDALLLHNLLGQMRRLEKLVLSLGTEIHTEASFDFARLPRLRSLDIGGFTADRLLDLLLLPNLEVLSMHTLVPPTFALVQSLIFRSSCALTTLNTNAEISEDDFIHIITTNPSLVAIDLQQILFGQLTDKAIAQLVFHQAGQDQLYLPKLEALRLRGHLAFDASLFVDMVESRWKGNGEGHAVARPHIICLEWDSESLSQPRNQDAFLRFNGDDFRGLTWKAQAVARYMTPPSPDHDIIDWS